jgi:spore photoproduct lyase
MACSYCYVARRKGNANPITAFVNIEEIVGSIERHAAKQGMKLEETQADPELWVYKLGTDSDLSVDAAVSDNVRDLVALFRTLPNAKATFATKFVNRELVDYDPKEKTRIRFSLMPPETSKLVDVRTFSLAMPIFERADERTRTADLLITSDNSRVAGVCTGLQIPHI